MASNNETSDVRVSNWTSATSTQPGERQVDAIAPAERGAPPGRRVQLTRSIRSVVVVSTRVIPARSLDRLLPDTADFDIVFVVAIAHAYSRIKLVAPDLVILSLEIDDLAACQIRAMLKADRSTAGVPVATGMTILEDSDLEDSLAGQDRDTPAQRVACPMN
jgi:hypothetical protein